MRTITLHGANLDDTGYSITLDGVEYTWNVTRLQRACKEDRFGPPVTLPREKFPPANYDNLDRDKIAAIKRSQESLDDPAIIIESPPGSPFMLFTVCDGNHRATARMELQLDVLAFIVPWEEAERFRIHITET